VPGVWTAELNVFSPLHKPSLIHVLLFRTVDDHCNFCAYKFRVAPSCAKTDPACHKMPCGSRVAPAHSTLTSDARRDLSADGGSCTNEHFALAIQHQAKLLPICMLSSVCPRTHPFHRHAFRHRADDFLNDNLLALHAFVAY